MKTYISKLLPVVFSVLIIASCSDNSTSPATQNQSADSLMYSFDSLVVYSDSLTQSRVFSFISDTCRITKFKVQCEFHTNDTSNSDTVFSAVSIAITNDNDTTGAFVKLAIGRNINNLVINETAILNFGIPFRMKGNVFLGFIDAPQNLGKFIRAKSFKLFKSN